MFVPRGWSPFSGKHLDTAGPLLRHHNILEVCSMLDIYSYRVPSEWYFSKFLILRHGLDLKKDLVLNGDGFLEIVSSF